MSGGLPYMESLYMDAVQSVYRKEASAYMACALLGKPPITNHLSPSLRPRLLLVL